jgi:hypothetical protein
VSKHGPSTVPTFHFSFHFGDENIYAPVWSKGKNTTQHAGKKNENGTVTWRDELAYSAARPSYGSACMHRMKDLKNMNQTRGRGQKIPLSTMGPAVDVTR